VVKDKLIGNFTEYITSQEFNSTIYKKYKQQVSAGRLLFFLLSRLFDKKEGEIQKFSTFFSLLIKEKILSSQDVVEGFSLFFPILQDIESDFPHLPTLLSDIMTSIFVVDKVAEFSKVTLYTVPDEGDEENFFMPDIIVKVLGVFIQKIWDAQGEETAKALFQDFGIHDKLVDLKPHILEEGIPEKLGEEFSVCTEVQSLLAQGLA